MNGTHHTIAMPCMCLFTNIFLVFSTKVTKFYKYKTFRRKKTMANYSSSFSWTNALNLSTFSTYCRKNAKNARFNWIWAIEKKWPWDETWRRSVSFWFDLFLTTDFEWSMYWIYFCLDQFFAWNYTCLNVSNNFFSF